MSLELFDFSPWWFVFDAHCLWHLATAPLELLYWSFSRDDCVYEMRKGKYIWSFIWESVRRMGCRVDKGEDGG